jgi:hypothetical protein
MLGVATQECHWVSVCFTRLAWWNNSWVVQQKPICRGPHPVIPREGMPACYTYGCLVVGVRLILCLVSDPN